MNKSMQKVNKIKEVKYLTGYKHRHKLIIDIKIYCYDDIRP